MKILLSDYADKRMRQRGARLTDIELVALEYDRRIFLKSGLAALSISRERAQKLREMFGDRLVSRIDNLSLIVNFDPRTIVTVVRGATYRPGQSRHRRGGRRQPRSHFAVA